MVSSKNGIAARYLESLEEPARSPLLPSRKLNALPKSKLGPDLDDLARQMNMETPTKITQARFNTPSATISSFKSAEKTKDKSKGYEYLCRIEAIKRWLEAVLGETIPQSPLELVSYIRNGIYLAKLANVFLPQKKAVFLDSKLQFRHTENINRFFKLLAFLEIPDLFRFELTDLYDAKDVPKVWFCLHAMSYRIHQLNSQYPEVVNLVNEVGFDEGDIRKANRMISGNLPNFASADGEKGSPGRSSYMDKAFGSPITPKRIFDDDPFRDKVVIEQTKIPDWRVPETPLKLNRPEPPVEKTALFEKSPVHSQVVDKTHALYTPELEAHMDNIVKLQALCKSAAFRYKMFVDRIMLRSYDAEITAFNSKIRGNLSRNKTVHRHRDEILWHESAIVTLQAVARRKLAKRIDKSMLEEDQVTRFQSICRGCIVRKRCKTLRNTLTRNVEQLTQLQSVIRSRTIKQRAMTVAKYRGSIEDSVLQLQSIARRVLYFKLRGASAITGNRDKMSTLLDLQAIARGGLYRRKLRSKLEKIHLEWLSLEELQSIGRGAILRTRLCNNVLITLIGEDQVMNTLFAKVRGNKVRRDFALKKNTLEAVAESEVLPLQSMFRGILTRFRMEVQLDDIYEEIDSLVALQSLCRGHFVRRDISRMRTHYTAHQDQVVRAQAILRSKYTQTAYKLLLNMKNPPLSVVRNFAYLLSDSEVDYLEEIELEELKDKIIEKSKANEDLALQIENLDIKLGLLDKNKITVEDFMKNSKYKTYRPIRSAGVKALDKLNKSSKQRVDLYLALFYFLQTKPAYWIRLYNDLVSNPAQCRKLQPLILSIFPLHESGVNGHSREEYFFMNFLCALMETDMSRCKNIADITKAKMLLWIDFFVDFNNHTHQRSHLKQSLGHVVQQVIEDELSFEPDPVKIYNQLVEKEMRVYGSTRRDRNVTPQDAIADKEVSGIFVNNLMALREVTSITLEAILRMLPGLPVHVKILAKKAHDLSQIHFPGQEDHHLAVAGAIFIKHYVAGILQMPENYGYKVPNGDNMKQLFRVLLQVFSMKPFTDNFLRPLDEFVMQNKDEARNMIRELISVRDLEPEYEMNDYDDIVSHERPLLTMKVTDMIAVEKLVTRHLDIVAPSQDDQLANVVKELNNVVNSADDFVTLSELGSLTLTLLPTTKEDTVAELRSKSLFSQAKRCLLYIIQVQDGDDLLELLIQGIKPVHEEKYKQVIKVERRPPKGSFASMSYVELKKLALRVILQLEQLGLVTRKSSYQQLLNQIVVDIRTKNTQRDTRRSQLRIARDTTQKLMEKERFLKRQLGDYNSHIDHVLNELQLRPKEKKIFNIIPVFSKQYFYHRELKKNNRLPKFGSYKYTAKKLMEQGVIKDFGGELHRRHVTSSKLDFMFSCHKLGTFVIEAAASTVVVTGACATITLDQILDKQYESAKTWVMFDGMVTFDTDALAGLLFRKFYDIKRD